jgi:integrase
MFSGPRLFWCCRPQGSKSWRYFPADPATVAAHPNGRYIIAKSVRGKRTYISIPKGEDPHAFVQRLNEEAILGTLVTGSTESVVYRLKAGQRRPDSESSAIPVLQQSPLYTAIEAYIADRKSHGKFEAAEKARVVLTEFVKCHPTVQTVRGIGKEHLTQFCNWLGEQNGRGGKTQSERTVSNKYNQLRSFLKFMGHDVKLPSNSRPTYTEKSVTTYNTFELTALMDEADEYMRVAVTLMLRLGLREREASTAEYSDIIFDAHSRVFKVQDKPHLNFKVKDKEQRTVPMADDVYDLLTAWHTARRKAGIKSKLILGIGNNGDQENGHLLRWLQRVAKRAGVTDATLHKFRRNYISTLANVGNIPIAVVQGYVGHSDLASIMRYLNKDDATQRARALSVKFY